MITKSELRAMKEELEGLMAAKVSTFSLQDYLSDERNSLYDFERRYISVKHFMDNSSFYPSGCPSEIEFVEDADLLFASQIPEAAAVIIGLKRTYDLHRGFLGTQGFAIIEATALIPGI